MNNNITFLNIVAEYCNTPADEITNDMRFIEDLGFSSLDFMTFLGDLEDTFDVEIRYLFIYQLVHHPSLRISHCHQV